MPAISFQLLQTPRVLLDGQQVLLPFKRAEALLYCLTLKRAISGKQAANLLWDSDDSQMAKKNLRHTLYTIRKTFDLELIVSPKKHLLTLNSELSYDIDYDNFMKNRDFSLCDGELMQSFGPKNADVFENWLGMERTELKKYYLRQLYDSMIQTTGKDVSEAESLFAKYVKKDPPDKRVHQLMMECYQRNGLYYKGIKVYQNISKLFNAKLYIVPCAELSQLHRELLSTWTQSSTEEPKQSVVHVIDRKGKVRYLMKSYRSFLLGTPAAIFVLGDNGVGKTYLVNRLFGSVDEDSCIVLKTICFRKEREFVFQPWNTVMLQLDQYIRSHNVSVPANYINHTNTLFPLFGDWPLSLQVPGDIMISYNYRTTRNSVLKLLSLVREKTPIILFFGNIQFMDNLSLELLSLIIHERNPNVMCICTYLDVQTPQLQEQIDALLREKFTTQLLLEPFSEQVVKDILTDRLGPDALSDQIIRHIYQDSGSNGSFLDLLMSYLTQDAGASSMHVPLNPQDILLARLEELSADSRQLLDTISVCPESITLDIVGYIFNRNALEIIELADDLKQHGLVREGVSDRQIRFQFHHTKMQGFAYSQLSPSKHRLLHARVANYYEQAAELVHNNSWYQWMIYHYTQTGSDAKVLRYKILSLPDYSRFDYELYPTLQLQKDSALKASKQLTKYFNELTAELVHLYNYQPNILNFAEMEAWLYLAIGKYYISQGQYKKGLDMIHHSLGHAEYLEKHPQMHIACLRQPTFYGIQMGDTELMYENIQKSMEIAKENRLGIGYTIECRLYGLYLLMCGCYGESREQLNQAINRLESASLDAQGYVLNLAACYGYLGEVGHKQRNFEHSLEYYDRALEICNSRKYPKNPTFYSNQACALFTLGKKEQTTDRFFTSSKLYGASNILVGRGITKPYCALLYAAERNFKSSKSLLAETERHAQMLASPISLDILERIKAILIKNYPEEFADVIPEGFGACYTNAEKYMGHLPGAYELYLPLELADTTI